MNACEYLARIGFDALLTVLEQESGRRDESTVGGG